MGVVITAFERSPDRGRGLARDMPVRWALEEVGEAYAVRLVSFEAMRGAGHLGLQPFGQIPTYEEEGGLVLFESGAIVLHVAGGRPGLLPAERAGRARATAWVFAALATVEPPIVERSMAVLFERERPWFEERLAVLDGRVRARLASLSLRLGTAEWLDGGFSAGDLMMVSVLRRLAGSGLLEEVPGVLDYVARGEARVAFKRAFAAQLAVFAEGGASGGLGVAWVGDVVTGSGGLSSVRPAGCGS